MQAINLLGIAWVPGICGLRDTFASFGPKAYKRTAQHFGYTLAGAKGQGIRDEDLLVSCPGWMHSTGPCLSRYR